jgi:exodeoxyribonuclease VIII
MIKKVIESNEKYHSSRAISASGLKSIHNKSVYHFINQKPYTSDAYQLGTAIHTLVLEPHLFDEQVKFYDKVDGRTAEGKEQKKLLEAWQEEGKLVFPETDREMFTIIKDNFDNNPTASKYAKGDVELSHYIEDFQGVYLRIRPDVINYDEGFISDVKTCRSNTPKNFRNDIYKYGYHIQATLYCDALGIDPSRFIFQAIETNHPYSVQCYRLSEDMIERGRADYENAIVQWREYLDTGKAPLYSWDFMDEEGVIIL